MKASIWKKTCQYHPSALVYTGVGGRRCMECNALVVADDTPDIAEAPTVTAPQPQSGALPIAFQTTYSGCTPGITDASALSTAKYSLGQFVADGETDDEITFQAGQEIKLFRYGHGDTPPQEAGFTSPGYDWSTSATNCLSQGRLCANGDGYFIVGLAARIGQPRAASGSAPASLSIIDMQIRERIAESAAVHLWYGDRCFRYELGTLIQRPLNGSVFGPTVSLDGEPVTDEAKLFVPFKIPAISTETDHAHITLTLGDKISIEAPGISAERRIVVPVKIWLFGYTIRMPEPIMCALPKTVTP
jgi:hypothetical protein